MSSDDLVADQIREALARAVAEARRGPTATVRQSDYRIVDDAIRAGEEDPMTEPQAMTTAGLQAKVQLRGAWFAAHPIRPIEDGGPAYERRRDEVERLFAAIELEAGGHAIPGPHDCFAMNCHRLGDEVRSLRAALAAKPEPGYGDCHCPCYGCIASSHEGEPTDEQR